MGARISQWHPIELEVIAAHFMQTVHPMVVGASRDQSPIWFTFNRQRTLELIGVCTVSICKLTSDTKWATLAVTITASGTMLTPILVFKGMPVGCIDTRDFPTYPCGCIYACQSSSWMVEVVILQWVEQVLTPYILEVPSHVVPLLPLDSYRCHMMVLVVT